MKQYDGAQGYDGCAGSGTPEKEKAHGMVENVSGDTVLSGPLHRMARTPDNSIHTSPRVTIIVPVYNHWDLTEACVERLVPLARHQNVEVLVINDGSTDDPPETWPSGEVQLIHKARGGFASACNYGAAHAGGKYLVFLNNDTRPEPGWLKPLVAALEHGAGIVGPLLLFPDCSRQSAGLVQDSHGDWRNFTGREPGQAVGGEVAAVTGACLAISRRLFWQLGGFDQEYQSGCEDVDLCLKARQAGYSIVLEPKSVVIHDEGQTRFKEPEIQKQIAQSQARLRERWGEDDGQRRLLDTSLLVDDSVCLPYDRSDDLPSSDASPPLEKLDGMAAVRGTAAIRQPVGAANPGALQDQRIERSGSLKEEERGRDELAGVLLGDDVSGRISAYPGSVLHRQDCGATGKNAPLVVVWEGLQDAETGGSLAIINQAVVKRLKEHNIFVASTDYKERSANVDAWISHYWPDVAAHMPPPSKSTKRWVCVIPWEYGPPPAAWEATWKHPKFCRLVSPSAYSRQLFLKYTSLKPGQVTVVPNGVDTSIFRPDGPRWKVRHEGITRFLFVGGVIWRKGIDLLEKAWDEAFQVGDPVRLTIKSMGRESFYRQQDVVDLTAWQQRRSDVRVIDEHLSQEDLAALYRTVDVLVAPSRAEGFCLPVLEAMASGCAVIVPQHGPTNEYTDDTCAIRSESVVWTDPQMHSYYEIPIDELAATLRWCVENPEARRRIGAAATVQAVRYSWENVASQYAQIIKEVCNG